MIKHILKKGVPEITIMDGEFKGTTYKHGVLYESIPPQYKASFSRKSVGVKRPFGKEKQPENKIKTEGK